MVNEGLEGSSKEKKEEEIGASKTPYLMILPVFIFLLFIIVPVFLSYSFAFFHFSISPWGNFVSLANYADALTDSHFYISLLRNIYLLVNDLFIQIPLAFVLAYGLNKKFVREEGILTAIYFLPVAISLVAMAVLWKWMLLGNGPINGVLGALHLPTFGWLTSTSPIIPHLVLPFLSAMVGINWIWFGLFTLVFLGGMREIPNSLWDSAKIDGLSELTKIRKIALPALSEVLGVVVILSVSGVFKSFAFIYNLTVGGPAYTTEIAGIYIYRTAFKTVSLDYAATLGSLVTVVSFILGSYMWYKLKRGE